MAKSKGAGGSTTGQKASGPDESAVLNMRAAELLLIAFLGSVVTFGVYNLVAISLRHMRRLATLNSDRQSYFAQRNAFADAKKKLIYAPLGPHRMNRGLAFKRIQLGSMPSRMQTLLLIHLVGINIYLLVRDLPAVPLPVSDLSQFYKRAATLALVNAIPLFVMAGRQNPLIALLGIDFNSFNTMHRWIGRFVVSLILIHAISYIYSTAQKGTLVASHFSIFD